MVPIGAGEHLTPEALADYLALDGAPSRDGWDVVAHDRPGIDPQEYAEAGATWLVRSVFPIEDDWERQADAIVREGPH